MNATKNSYYRDWWAYGLVGLLSVQGQAATDIGGGMDSGLPGAMVTIPVSLGSEASVVGVQLDLGFDSSQLTFTGATAGAVLDPAHIVRDGEIEPGVNRVLIYSEANLLVPDGEVLNLNFDVGSMATVGTEMVSLSMVLLADPDAAEVPTDSVTDGDVEILPDSPVVVNRRLFYNNSAFDDADDSDAIATDKTALLPGGTASFANYSSFNKGINGVIVDIQGLADPDNIDLADFSFFVGNSNDLASWTQGPDPLPPTVAVGGGMNGSDRIFLEWADGVIQKEWLEVTVLDAGATGLATQDVFYFGNAVGDTGNSGANTQVTVSDENAARQNPRNFLDPAPIDFAYDFNRDKFVNISDENIARQNATNFLTDLELLDLSALPTEGLVRASVRRQVGELAFDGVGADHLGASGDVTRDREEDALGSVAGAIELTIRRDETTGRLFVEVSQENGLVQLQTSTNLANAEWRNVSQKDLIEGSRDAGRTSWVIEPQESFRLFRAVREGELVDF